jgi:hypothetical protein
MRRVYIEVAESTEFTEKSGESRSFSMMGRWWHDPLYLYEGGKLHYAARGAGRRRGRENRTAPVGMTRLKEKKCAASRDEDAGGAGVSGEVEEGGGARGRRLRHCC